jgi:hypothetical protein
MEKFIGTKIIKADPSPVTWGGHYKNMGWEWPENKEGKDRIGYKVGYSDANGDFNGDKEGGCEYISWSPKDVFDAAYQKISPETFETAIEVVKSAYSK